MPLTLEYMPVVDLPENPQNPKLHSDEIDASIERHGFVDPVIIDERTGLLLSGHGRREALMARQARGEDPPLNVEVDADGRWLAPVVRGVHTESDVEAGALIVGINALVPAGGWDPDRLAGILAEVARTDMGLDGVGFTHGDLELLLEDLALTDPVEASEGGSRHVEFDAAKANTVTCPKCACEFLVQ